MGGMLFEMMKPAKILPIASRLMGLINRGLFSLMLSVVVLRGWSSSA